MTDPIPITTLTVTVAQVLSVLYDYGKSVNGAKQDINKLSHELFALKGTLKHIDEHCLEATSKPRDVEVLNSTEEFPESLLHGLDEPRSSVVKRFQTLKWLPSRNDMTKHLARLERVKSWLI